jgi:hypothetical protein
VSGKYEFTACTDFNAGATGHRELTVRNITQSVTRQLGYFGPTSASFPQVLNGSVTIRMLAGETADIQVYQDNGGNLLVGNNSTVSHLSIKRTGNY